MGLLSLNIIYVDLSCKTDCKVVTTASIDQIIIQIVDHVRSIKSFYRHLTQFPFLHIKNHVSPNMLLKFSL